MSSIAGIGILNPDETVTYVTLYAGNEPRFAGRILTQCYTDETRVRALLNLGALSRLGGIINPPPKTRHLFTKPVDNVCVAYHRDRRDTFQQFTVTLEQYHEENNLDYKYLFADEEWHVAAPGRLPFQKVTGPMINESILPYRYINKKKQF